MLASALAHLAVASVPVVLLTAAVEVSAGPASAATATSAFVAAAPCRLADVRTGAGVERLDPQVVRVAVRGRCGVPADAVAVALTVTVDATGSAASGYVSIWPEGAAVPTASIVNHLAREARANGAIVALGAPGTVAVQSLTGAPVVVDVTGWFVPATATAAGRFVPIDPVRAVDTRTAPLSRPLGRGETVTVPLPPGVPTDASAVAITITTTEAPAASFLAVSPAGTPRPASSAVNNDAPRQTRAAGAIVGVTPAGLDVYSLAGGHVLVDVTGWFTSASAPVGRDGLFVPEPAPRRLLDTRKGDPLWAAGSTEIANVSADAAALAVTVTIAQPRVPGFVTAHAARRGVPRTSTVNGPSTGEFAASMAIVPASTAGIALYSSGGSDVIVDIAGWFTGTPAATLTAPATNVRPPECAGGMGPTSLTAMFRDGAAFTGADYQRPMALPDGRVLWLFQDVYVRGRGTHSGFVHNAGLVQSGACFTVLTSGTFADPGEYLFPAETRREHRWFWPLGGDMGADGRFHVFVAEMRENGAAYLSQSEPIATWIATIDLSTMQVVDRRPATDSSAALYGFSVASDDAYTYLYAHCHRQFGWDAFPFSDPPVYVHDWDCVQRMTVARVPKGQFDQPLAYWDGSGWGPTPGSAANIAPGGRLVSASQIYADGPGRWIAVTKVGDWFGGTIEIDVASQPQGPFTTVRTIAVPNGCPTCNTYFASLVPYRMADGSWMLGISHNVFGPVDLSRYDPTFFTIAPV